MSLADGCYGPFWLHMVMNSPGGLELIHGRFFSIKGSGHKMSRWSFCTGMAEAGHLLMIPPVYFIHKSI